MLCESPSVEHHRCYGIYIGTVLQHLSHGKLKVYVHGIYPESCMNDPSTLPTCMQIVPQFGGSHNGNGVFSYPNVGSTVVCSFANGDQNFPIMLGSLQGGENAFGQYEIIKAPNEISSTRHLITSGKSHVEMYENGKISAIVVDPIRTEAKVKYSDDLGNELSIDAVSSRPTCEKVDAEEISSINCQFVLDNHDANGTMSCSTHWFNPANEKNMLSIDNGQTIVVSSLIGEERNDYSYVANNVGMVDDGQVHSSKSTFSMTKTSSAQGSVQQYVHPLTSQVSVLNHYGIDGIDSTKIIRSLVDSSNFMQKDASGNIISTLNSKVDASSEMYHDASLAFLLDGNVKSKLVQSYSNSSSGQSLTKQLQEDSQNALEATSNMDISIKSKKKSKLTETDTLTQIQPHTNKHDASTIVHINSDTGFMANGIYNDDDLKVLPGSTLQITKKNIANVEATTSPKALVKMYAHDNVKKTINDAVVKNDVECKTFMLPADGTLEISISDNIKHSSCKVLLNSNGVASIESTTSIDISAPIVNIKGQTMTQQFKSITSTASTMNITAAAGDCRIANVSLLNHKHTETQAGDIVSPQPSKTASQSN